MINFPILVRIITTLLYRYMGKMLFLFYVKCVCVRACLYVCVCLFLYVCLHLHVRV